MKINLIIALIPAILLASCKSNKDNFDASGSFETEETIIASEASGIIKQFDIQEGATLSAGQYIGYIDSTQLYLKKKQLEAQISALLGRKPDISAQLASLQEQLKVAQREQNRISNLVKAGAAPPKQLDDATSQVEILQK